MQGTVGVLSACLLTAAMLGNVLAQAPAAGSSASAEADEAPVAQIAEEIRQKLHEPVTIDLKDVPLRDAVELLLSQHRVDFWFDERALKENEINLDDVEVTCNLHNVSLRAALKRILTQAQLSWVCEDAGVRITTAEAMQSKTFARIYEISELLEEAEVEVVMPQAATHQTQFGGGVTPNVGNGLEGMVGIGQPLTPEEAKAAAELKAKEASRPENILIQTIQQATGGVPDAPWLETDGEGGSIHLIKTTNTKLLVIRQTEFAHAEIEDLLNDLLSHHHQYDDEEGEEASATKPKTAVRVIPRKSVRIVTKRHSTTRAR